MKYLLFLLPWIFCFISCKGQKTFGTDLLKLDKVIKIPKVKGRIDHMAINPKDDILYVAALGNNTVEVIDLNKGSIIKSINGIQEPQGIAYIPDQNEIAIASGGNGDCIFYNASNFEKVATIHLSGDADNVRYDVAEKKLYVGYGDGGLSKIDPLLHKQIGDVKLPAHPESFQLDKKNNRIFVNLPDANCIAVVDLNKFSITDIWKIPKYRANFAMALDTLNNLVLVGFRHPALLVAYGGNNGKEIDKADMTGDVDDLFYFPEKQEIIASGGEGYINIFLKKSSGLRLSANISTTPGARTSLLLSSQKRFILAERAYDGNSALIAVYKLYGLK